MREFIKELFTAFWKRCSRHVFLGEQQTSTADFLTTSHSASLGCPSTSRVLPLFGLPSLNGLGAGNGKVHRPLSGFPEEVDFGWVQPCVGAVEAGNDPLSSALGTSLCLSSQESEVSEPGKQLQLSDSAASDPRSFLGLVSLSPEMGVGGWGAVGSRVVIRNMDMRVTVVK